MRGTVGSALATAWQNRITPAHAGNRVVAALLCPLFGDHPRPCGEQCLRRLRKMHRRGSPPPMRGTVSYFRVMFRGVRITPAHAGNSAAIACSIGYTWDHPRPCGEQLLPLKIAKCTKGSPPPMRGTVKNFTNGSRTFRITPAHAGNSRVLCYVSTVT